MKEKKESKSNRIIVLGCGHTGTTLISGILHLNGFGFKKVSTQFEPLRLNELTARAKKEGLTKEIKKHIEKFFKSLDKKENKNWAVKDPKLCYWIDEIDNVIPKPYKVIFNFRKPGSTVQHLADDRVEFEGMSRKKAREDAESHYLLKNKNVMDFLKKKSKSENKKLLYVNYDDLVDRYLVNIIDRFVRKKLNYGFIKPRKRKAKEINVSEEVQKIYARAMKNYMNNISQVVVNYETVKNTSVAERVKNWCAEQRVKVRRNIWFLD